MIFRVTMKTPDVMLDNVVKACESEYGTDEYYEHGEDSEDYDLIQEKVEEVLSVCKKWFGYGEYLTVEIDTEKQTCTVVEE